MTEESRLSAIPVSAGLPTMPIGEMLLVECPACYVLDAPEYVVDNLPSFSKNLVGILTGTKPVLFPEHLEKSVRRTLAIGAEYSMKIRLEYRFKCVPESLPDLPAHCHVRQINHWDPRLGSLMRELDVSPEPRFRYDQVAKLGEVIGLYENSMLIGMIEMLFNSDAGSWGSGLVIDPDWRGQGLARLLVLHAIHCVGAPRMELFCNRDLRSVYAGWGMTELGRVCWSH